MEKQIFKILITLGIIILLGFVFSYGYWFVSQYIPQKEMRETPLKGSETPPVQKITLSGEVKKFENSLIVAAEEGDLEILVDEGTEFFLPTPSQEEKRVIAEQVETESTEPVAEAEPTTDEVTEPGKS